MDTNKKESETEHDAISSSRLGQSRCLSLNQTVNVADDELVWMVNSKQNVQGWGLERLSLEIMTQVGQFGTVQ